ncbi:hypothetical protein F5X68DRAFT_32329 [Plectosphaerella plurivora]|uniref:Uncharacterized protein n=1 Tax=Plectosphaerella plurivora TaxID=936078 RepID=A0A9P8VLP7_9PEZI|nr:hypothetical protein F5X68DRAFT_32329 [Plectosphaerella plurivora]
MSSLVRGPGRRLMTTARCGSTVMPRTLASIATLRPDLGCLQKSPFSPIANQKRRIHWTGAIESAVQSSEDALVFLHTTVGLPWYWALPVFAMGVNAVFRFPLQYYARTIFLKQFSTLHLFQAWFARHSARFPLKTTEKLTDKTRKRLFKERGCPAWKGYLPVLSVAPWLVVAQATRNLTGAGDGIISLVAPSAAHAVEGTSMTTLAETTAWIDEITATAQPVAESIHQSLTTGGMLWFHDLTVADPYTILPVILSLSFLHNVLPKGLEDIRSVFMPSKAENLTLRAKSRTTFRRMLVLVAVMAPFLTMNLPAGMLLYWCWSSSLGSVNSAILSRMLPPPKKKVDVCKGKPVRLLTE